MCQGSADIFTVKVFIDTDQSSFNSKTWGLCEISQMKHCYVATCNYIFWQIDVRTIFSTDLSTYSFLLKLEYYTF